MMRVLRDAGVGPLPRKARRSMIGSSWPRTFASPRIQPLAPGTRVRGEGTPSTSRASSRATRYSSPAMRSATPTHSPTWLASAALLAVTARPRRSSSARSSNGLSRRVLSATLSCMSGSKCSLCLLDQLVGRHRLDQIVDRALPQPPGTVRLLALGSDHDNRDGASLRIVQQRARGLVAVDAGHDDVHENQVRAHLAREFDAFGTIDRDGR